MLFRRAIDPAVLDLLEESGSNAERAALRLRDVLAELPEMHDAVADLVRCEHEGDRITHDIIHGLNLVPRGRRAPLDPAEGHALASAIDDVVDFAEQAADQLAIYGVEAPMEQGVALCDVLVGATEQVALALGALRRGRDLAPHIVEIHRLENEGDRLSRDAVASLFQDGIDPMVVIRWKDVFESLEASIDACETVAHVLEGITLRRR